MLELDPLVDQVALTRAQERPELVAGDLLADILRRNRQAQGSERYPYLTGHGAYGYVGKEFDTLFDDGHDSWRASVALNWSLFDVLLTKGLVQETEAQIRRTEAELDGPAPPGAGGGPGTAGQPAHGAGRCCWPFA